MSNIKKHLDHDWNVICDVCGRKKKKSQTTLAYGSGDIPIVVSCLDGCADERHPLNSPPPVIFDGRPVPNARPDTKNTGDVVLASAIIAKSTKWGSFPSESWGSFDSGYSKWGSFSGLATIYASISDFSPPFYP